MLSALNPQSLVFLLWHSGLRTQRSVPEDVGSIPGLAQWLWHRPAAAALTQPLARELLHVAGAALQRKKKPTKFVKMKESVSNGSRKRGVDQNGKRHCPRIGAAVKVEVGLVD